MSLFSSQPQNATNQNKKTPTALDYSSILHQNSTVRAQDMVCMVNIVIDKMFNYIPASIGLLSLSALSLGTLSIYYILINNCVLFMNELSGLISSHCSPLIL